MHIRISKKEIPPYNWEQGQGDSDLAEYMKDQPGSYDKNNSLWLNSSAKTQLWQEM